MKHGYIIDLPSWVDSITDREYNEYLDLGINLEEENTPEIDDYTLDRYKRSDRYLDAGDIMDELFPGVDADIFLTHSHEDSYAVTAFAGYLCKLGRKPFVDSFVWENIYELLRKVNDKYSRGRNGRMNYEDVVEKAAQVYMILNSALIKMMDKTDDYILLESPESLKSGSTFSPWIYSEILYSQILCPKGALNEEAVMAHSEFIYPAYTKHLIALEPNGIAKEFAKQRFYYVNKH